jgi:hypothetical protein
MVLDGSGESYDVTHHNLHGFPSGKETLQMAFQEATTEVICSIEAIFSAGFHRVLVRESLVAFLCDL